MGHLQEGEARRVLLDLPETSLSDQQALHIALVRRFRDITPTATVRQQFQERSRKPGERLGIFAAKLRYLAQRGFLTFTMDVVQTLTMEVFIKGLIPEQLRQQVRLANPLTLEKALERPLAIEEILCEMPELCEQVLEQQRGPPRVGHFWVNKMLQQSYYLGQSRCDVEDFCCRCDACVARKGPQAFHFRANTPHQVTSHYSGIPPRETPHHGRLLSSEVPQLTPPLRCLWRRFPRSQNVQDGCQGILETLFFLEDKKLLVGQ
ncbi:hypothetical protein SKAU_G00278730 [Synaphobranchus kaupii]|uniref:Uncharacterized protein n=1 Tax=Synaphobranchus kaupii TaxID=118154 RepID=A0A9Q1EWP7_SYNKA|nr:hypothetical protein SKAU_G00278730 [Synaphobranchus kaupii]